jgi:hypothetical protein
LCAEVDKHFGATLKDCPGTTKCRNPKPAGKWCGECPLKEFAPSLPDEEAKDVALHAHRLVAEKRAGYGRTLEELEPLEWELILLWEGREAANRNAQFAGIVDAAEWLKAFIQAWTQPKK